MASANVSTAVEALELVKKLAEGGKNSFEASRFING